jgi:hypothetical protein
MAQTVKTKSRTTDSSENMEQPNKLLLDIK